MPSAVHPKVVAEKYGYSASVNLCSPFLFSPRLSAVTRAVWSNIFYFFMQHGVGCYRLAFRLRNVLLHVCRIWRWTVEESPQFWTRLHLCSTSSSELAIRMLNLSAALPVELRLDLRDSRYPGRTQDLDVILHTIREHLHRITTLTGVFDSDSSRRCFQRSILVARLPDLGRFIITAGSQPSFIRNPPYIITWTSFSAPCTSLRLQCVPLAWIGQCHSSHLKTVVLRDLPYEGAPTWSDFLSFIGSVPHLQRLCVRRVGCRKVPDVRPRLPPLHWLEELDICFGADTSFEHALISMRMPALKTFKFFAQTADEFDALSRCSYVLATITTFVLDGAFEEKYEMMRVFLNTPSLVFLELLCAEYAVTEALLAGDRFLSRMFRTQCLGCPNLSVVAFRGSSWDLGAAFITRRYRQGGRLSQAMFGESVAFWCVYDADAHTIFLRPAVMEDAGRLYVRHGEPRWIHND